MIEIKKIVTGQIEENCYLLYNETNLLIVDPGSNGSEIKKLIDETERQPVAILLTHAHWDHIGAVDDLRAAYEIPVYIHEKEWDWLADPTKNLSNPTGRTDITGIVVREPDKAFELKKYSLGGMEFKVVYTPGHSIGSVSFIFDGFVVSGDALFKGSVGRSDLPTGNANQLIAAIKKELLTLPADYQVLPGHGENTTIGHESQTNPFLI